jgi:glycosyltransferase involved in cell wall biosynthesis
MKVLIIHNDLRVYWKRRLIYLREYLKAQNIDLYAVELFGKGSPYDFDLYQKEESWWDCLFPDQSAGDLSKSEIKNRIFSRLDEVNPDVVIGGSIVFYAGALGLRWAKRNGRKFIMFDDAKATDVKRNVLVQTIKNLITRQIDALWLPSNDYASGYSPLFNKKNVHFFYGYNCVDNDQFKVNEEASFDKNTIICIARLVPIKNIENLLKAWNAVEAANETYKLIIIGDGSLITGLKQLAQANSLKRVQFLGAMSNEKVVRHLHDADALILPSWAESWGLVVNEAMAAGLPVLLSNKVNAAGTLLQEGVNGYSFSPGNISEMQQKLVDFVKLSRPAKKQMSANSLNIIKQMDFENMGNQLATALKLVGGQSKKSYSPLSSLFIELWYGRYNTLGWDKAGA